MTKRVDHIVNRRSEPFPEIKKNGIYFRSRLRIIVDNQDLTSFMLSARTKDYASDIIGVPTFRETQHGPSGIPIVYPFTSGINLFIGRE